MSATKCLLLQQRTARALLGGGKSRAPAALCQLRGKYGQQAETLNVSSPPEVKNRYEIANPRAPCKLRGKSGFKAGT